MLINRVQVVWSGALTVGGGLSTFYFDQAVGTALQQATAVATFLGSTENRRSTSTSWQISPDVATLDDATGTLQGVFSITAPFGVGSVAGDQIPPATQGLLRLLSNVVVGGRLLRGRLFLPGALEADSTGAAPNAAYTSGYNAAANTLIADVNSTWLIWSRRHGTSTGVTSVSTWNKWAVLRSRRD